MKLVFAGTADVAVESLVKLNEQHEILAVLTNPDAPTGRGKKLTPSAVKVAALDLGLQVVHSFDELLELRLEPQLGVVVAYGKIFSEQQLSYPTLGWVNLHFSLLPCLRGASPVQTAILSGDASTGVTVFRIQKGMDDGPIVLQKGYEIVANTTSDELFEQLATFGADVFDEAVELIADNQVEWIDQDDSCATYTKKLLKQDAKVDWSRPAKEIVQKINAFSSNPGAWFELHQIGKEPQRIVALKAQVGTDNDVQLLKVKPAGKGAMDAKAWLNGVHGEYRFE